jgi:hypothetical protein
VRRVNSECRHPMSSKKSILAICVLRKVLWAPHLALVGAASIAVPLELQIPLDDRQRIGDAVPVAIKDRFSAGPHAIIIGEPHQASASVCFEHLTVPVGADNVTVSVAVSFVLPGHYSKSYHSHLCSNGNLRCYNGYVEVAKANLGVSGATSSQNK